MPSAAKIQDYAAVGDGRSIALISRDGSLDWLCWPRFDSPSLFAGLLDSRVGGAWSIRPTQPAKVERRYLADTNVLETRFGTATGVLVLTDFMPAASEEAKRRMLWPEQELMRHVECDQGEVEVQVDFDPRPDFGRSRAVLRDAGKLGLRLDRGSHLFTLLSDVKVVLGQSGAACRFSLPADSSATFSLSYSSEGPAVLSPPSETFSKKLELTVDWWRRWAARARYSGPYRDQVVRSALALKLLSYAPSGAIVAAATTSLPERVGGDLNWDYRYCWLRDAAMTVRALFGLGYREDAEAFVSWMLHATRLTRPKLRVLYDVHGESPPPETELMHLAGFADSRPVRVGNAAQDQLQLDMYGGLIEAVTYFVSQGGNLDREEQTLLRQCADYARDHWQDPDNGIWEPRDRRECFTLSRVLCWVALDRLLEMHRQGRMQRIPVEQFSGDRERIRRDIQTNCWNETLRCYTQVRGGETLDAALLLLAVFDFEDPSSDRMRQTYQRLQKRLRAGPGLIYRYEQSLEAGEGAFAICCFWVADFLARGGSSLDEAHEFFGQTLSYANDVGLFAEEIDPKTGDAVGNFPQAFTHVGLINAALSLAEREERERARHTEQPVHDRVGVPRQQMAPEVSA
ncbi:MAG TPA: glycoside hydrolase family 15 protein [Pirellulales bacterium]|nr:glycoside hydrolase family 15 protein [Pirellulales bacterium]